MIEKWKTLKFEFESKNKMQISNFGNVRTYNNISDGKILKGSVTSGYKIIKFRIYKPINEILAKKNEILKGKIKRIEIKIKKKSLVKGNKLEIKALNVSLLELKSKLKKNQIDDFKNRTVFQQFLVHRMVAEFFLPKPLKNQVVVSHLDFDKTNNKVDNLKWMTLEENYEHQKKFRKPNSKFVFSVSRINSYKLNREDVCSIKKSLMNNDSVNQIAKQHKVSETQIRRIKSGENWSSIDV